MLDGCYRVLTISYEGPLGLGVVYIEASYMCVCMYIYIYGLGSLSLQVWDLCRATSRGLR